MSQIHPFQENEFKKKPFSKSKPNRVSFSTSKRSQKSSLSDQVSYYNKHLSSSDYLKYLQANNNNYYNENQRFESPYINNVHSEDIKTIPEDIQVTNVTDTILSMNHNSQDTKKETITVYGSGDLGRGLVACLVRGGYRVVVASRNPAKAKKKVASVGGETMLPEIAIQESTIILVAIPFEAYEDLLKYERFLKGKILVDVSNRPPDYDKTGPSMAQQLQDLVPDAVVVKAMNTLSAYALSRGLVQGSKQVPVCSNSDEAKFKVIELVQKLGFTPLDFGSLSESHKVEDIPLEFFPEWKTAFITAASIFLCMWIVVFFRKQLCPNFVRAEGEPWKWDLFHDFPLKSSGNAAAVTSFNLLAACYFPGVLAAYIQLKRGTKYSEFPNWLDNWMKIRKQLGLFALLLSAAHGIFAIMLKIAGGLDLFWADHSGLALGIISLGLMVVLGITSLPSVSSTLTWKEFFFVQSYLGWASFSTAFLHTIFVELYDIFSSQFKCTIIPHQAQIGLVLPTITMLMKLPLIFPCVDSYLVKIRRGYERNPAKYSQKPVNTFAK